MKAALLLAFAAALATTSGALLAVGGWQRPAAQVAVLR